MLVLRKKIMKLSFMWLLVVQKCGGVFYLFYSRLMEKDFMKKTQSCIDLDLWGYFHIKEWQSTRV